MKANEVVWPNPIIHKLRAYRNERFTAEETYDYIIQLIMETEELLLNPIFGRAYIEESGEYKGFARIIVRKWRIYSIMSGSDIIISAVMYPGEN